MPWDCITQGEHQPVRGGVRDPLEALDLANTLLDAGASLVENAGKECGLCGSVSIVDTGVSFRWKDYRHHDKAKVMTLAADEFIRRFLLHALPDGFHRIRHYGFLANRQRAAKLALCRRLLDAPPPEPSAEQVRDAVAPCPSCGGAMVVLGVLARPAPCRTSFWDDTS